MNMYRLVDDDVIDHMVNDIIINCIYSLLKESPTPTKQQVEDFYDGNICRCTGNIYVLLESVWVCHVTFVYPE